MRAPTPLMPCSASMLVGRSRASSRSVVSWKMTYGGTPRERAISRRTGAQPLEQVAIDVLPGLGFDPRSLRDPVLHRPALARQHEPALGFRVPQQPDTALGQRHDREPIVCLPQKPVRDQLLDVAPHLRHRRAAQQRERASARDGAAT